MRSLFFVLLALLTAAVSWPLALTIFIYRRARYNAGRLEEEAQKWAAE